eukprot:66930-Chlamydomonas_euryale.AAC.2
MPFLRCNKLAKMGRCMMLEKTGRLQSAREMPTSSRLTCWCTERERELAKFNVSRPHRWFTRPSIECHKGRGLARPSSCRCGIEWPWLPQLANHGKDPPIQITSYEGVPDRGMGAGRLELDS